MKSSETIAALAAALAKAQAEIQGAIKDKKNPHFKSQYADISNVIDAVRPAYAKYGLSFTQVIHDATDAVGVETLTIHESGEWLSNGIIFVPVSKKDAQGYGSALTYGRRYSLVAAAGVAQEDDDGNAAVKTAPPAKKLDADKMSDIHLYLVDAAKEGIKNLQDVFKSIESSEEKNQVWKDQGAALKAAAEKITAHEYEKEQKETALSIEEEDLRPF